VKRRGGSERKVYRVLFLNQGQLFEVYARGVGQGTLFGFVEVEGILFGERTSVVVDPSEEKLKTEFAGVQRFSVPIHAVVRIDEVEREGVSRIAAAASVDAQVTPFPGPILGRPPKDRGRS
jgi:hypothetical protein